MMNNVAADQYAEQNVGWYLKNVCVTNSPFHYHSRQLGWGMIGIVFYIAILLYYETDHLPAN